MMSRPCAIANGNPIPYGGIMNRDNGWLADTSALREWSFL